jgi:hypothetical protein
MVTKRGKETPEVSTGNDHLDIHDNRVNTENSTTSSSACVSCMSNTLIILMNES